MFSRCSKWSSKIKEKCSQESKRNRRKMNIKSREEKLVCKGIWDLDLIFDYLTIFTCVTKKKTKEWFKIFDKWTLKIGTIWNLLKTEIFLKRMNISSQIFVTSGTKQKYHDWYLEKMLSRKERFFTKFKQELFLLIFFSWMHDLRERKKRKLLYFCIVIQLCYCSYFLYIIQWDQRFEIYNVFNQIPDKA